MKKVSALLFILVIYSSLGWSQTCTMNISTRKVCLGNTVSFSVSITGGGTISGYSWSFGNSVTSTQTAPTYQYPSTGTFTPSVTINFFGGGSCNASGLPITVFPLPNAKFSFTTSSAQCFKNNRVCIKNISTQGSTAPLDTGNFNWDDGTKVFFKSIFGQIFCHTYTDPFGGIYTPVLQITDTNGCFSRLAKTDSITIFPKMSAVTFSSFFTPQCPVTPVKFTNHTLIPKSFVKKFKWNFGDGSYDTTRWDTLTHVYTKQGIFDAILSVTDINNCTDSFLLSNAGVNSILDRLIHVSLSPRQCFRGNNFLISSNNPGAQVSWALFNSDNIRIDTNTQNPFHLANYKFTNCGTYRIRMYVSYPGSVCNIVADTFLDVYGPNAIIQNDTFKIKEQIQCQIRDTVHFRNPLPYLHCHNGNTNMIRLWNFGDVYSPQCTTDTKNGINVNMNCNWSYDSMNIWHYYTPGKEQCYTVTVFMKDTVLGCWDSDTTVMKLMAPSAHWDSTTNPIRRGVYYTANPVCIGNTIRFYYNEVLPRCGYDSAWLMPDSACKGPWILVTPKQNYIDYTYLKTCDSSGWVTYGAIVKNGVDRFGNTCYDTAWYHFKIFMIPINPAFDAKTFSTCQPYTVHLNMVDSIQDSIVKAQWFYQLQTSYVSLGGTIIASGSFTQILTPPLDSIIHGQTIIVPAQGVLFVSLVLTNSRGCQKPYQIFIPLGYQKDVAILKPAICLGDTDMLYDQVLYFNSTYPFWEDSTRAKANKEKLWWDLGDGNGFSISKHNPVIKYSFPGVYHIRLAMQDSLGCRDTVTAIDSINVISISAQMNKFDTIQYCAPFFVNFKDSTIIKGNDTVATWEWTTSDFKPRSLIKNPQHEFTSNGIFSIKLIAVSTIGCTDTVTKFINIKGPQPSFDIISDTVGCKPFLAKFRNTTGRQLINWQWNFRDPSNTIFSTTRDTDVSFIYNSPGIYKIRLFGQDTIRDPATNTLKPCRAYFPDTTTELPVRVIHVLPSANAQIIGPDSICPNEIDTFIGRTDSSFHQYKWYFGGSDSLTKYLPDSMVTYGFPKSGIYRMTLVPASTTDPRACVDSAVKNIVVRNVKADFVIDESQTPVYQFNNKSLMAVSYKWFIGKDLTNLFSQDFSPSKTFTDTGAISICLQAFNGFGCWDTTCKQITAKQFVHIPNVFTPDNNDGMNDAFDIDIAGFTKYELIIYNRWGSKVFIGEKDGNGNDGINWNGKEYNSGAKCSQGTYFFIFTYKLATDLHEKTVHGSVTLLRSEN